MWKVVTVMEIACLSRWTFFEKDVSKSSVTKQAHSHKVEPGDNRNNYENRPTLTGHRSYNVVDGVAQITQNLLFHVIAYAYLHDIGFLWKSKLDEHVCWMHA